MSEYQKLVQDKRDAENDAIHRGKTGYDCMTDPAVVRAALAIDAEERRARS